MLLALLHIFSARCESHPGPQGRSANLHLVPSPFAAAAKLFPRCHCAVECHQDKPSPVHCLGLPPNLLRKPAPPDRIGGSSNRGTPAQNSHSELCHPPLPRLGIPRSPPVYGRGRTTTVPTACASPPTPG